MSSVRFNLRDKSANNTSIRLIYQVNNAKFTYSTRESVPPKYWNHHKREVRQSFGVVSEKINNKLTRIRSLVYSIEADFHKKGEVLTRNKLRDTLNEKLYGEKASTSNENESTNSFNGYINLFIKRRAADPNFANGTIKVYKRFRKHWTKFCKGKKLEFSELTVSVLESFKFYLINHKFKYSDNLIDKMIRTGKVILNDATERGFNTNMDYKSKIFSHSPKPADNIYLTTEELIRIYHLKLPKEGKQRIYRDLFIVGAFTGLRYSDFTSIVPENIMQIWNKDNTSTKVLKVNMQKVNDHVLIPVHPIVEAILKKHQYNLNQYNAVNQVMNRALKQIGKLAGIDDEIVKVVYRNGRGDKTSYKKYELICTHTARRSFATNAYKAGIPAISIMKITGHKTNQSFMKYICIDEEENALLMARHEFFAR
jgi:integrase